MIDIPYPSNLREVRRYEDPQVGTIVEYIPRDRLLAPEYWAEVNLLTDSGPQSVRFKLDGHTLEEALGSWGDHLRAIVADIESRALRQKLLAPASGMRRA